ncbi:hypothetical protein L596_008558 [Steinernema carpocapsae]|uniref:Poly(A) RNA polymerase mitochondrial-like central palm domain-containing protein n=1 Tax=Steinernema carpocapsae TaxID=34508 RepID=A0A4U5PCV1_STECR|nr:hypothetical protein L596_008558 [Steinernema carpocapsae]
MIVSAAGDALWDIHLCPAATRFFAARREAEFAVLTTKLLVDRTPIGHHRSTQCNSAGLLHLIFVNMESLKKNTPQPSPSFVLCNVARSAQRSCVFSRLCFRPPKLGWRHDNGRPFRVYSTEEIFRAQLTRHERTAHDPHPFEDLCSSFDSESEKEELEEEGHRSLSPSASDRSIFTDDVTTVATDVDDHCSEVSSTFADGWVSSHEDEDDDRNSNPSSIGKRTAKFFIPLLGETEDASSEEEREEKPVDPDLVRLISPYNIPGFTLPMVSASSKAGSEATISNKTCPSVGGESGYLSCESVSPPPASGSTTPSTESKLSTPLQPPTDLFQNGQFEVSTMDVLSEQIWYFHNDITQTDGTLYRKMALKNHLHSIICNAFPMSGLYIVGSSLNGFGNNSSDMDLCLMITNKDLDQRTDAVVVLNHVMNCLINSELIRENGLKLIIAKVPILRIKFNAPYDDITVDLNANNAVAIKNTHLLCHYAAFDWRVRPLVSVIKEWAKRRGMNDANKSSFTSYSLVLMVVHFLQCGLSKPLLPSLQKMYPKRFSEKNDVRNLQKEKPLDLRRPASGSTTTPHRSAISSSDSSNTTLLNSTSTMTRSAFALVSAPTAPSSQRIALPTPYRNGGVSASKNLSRCPTPHTRYTTR